MMKQIISPTKKLQFKDYRKIRAKSDEVFYYFGYETENQLLKHPKAKFFKTSEKLKSNIKEVNVHIDLNTERANREFIVAPIILEVLRHTTAKLRANYWFELSLQLKGYLSYLFSKNDNVLLVESAELKINKIKYPNSKNISFRESGMNKSFRQLGVELIALDKSEETDKNLIYGVITNGNTWQFAHLNRKRKIILLDLRTFDIFGDFEELIQILVGVLEGK